MDNSLYYLSINRQRGLAAEMSVIANNIANLDTPGFRREGMLFAEHVVAIRGADSVSMADLDGRFASDRPGTMRITGGTFDLAIEGDGFFALEDAGGIRLSRAGGFQVSEQGFLVAPDGARVLDEGQGPIPIPPGSGRVEIAPDGTLSADGQEQARVGLFTAPGDVLTRAGETGFRAEPGDVAPLEAGRIRQGAIEGSNVDGVREIARMIEVSRAYERAQNLVRDEDERIRDTIRTLGQPA